MGASIRGFMDPYGTIGFPFYIVTSAYDTGHDTHWFRFDVRKITVLVVCFIFLFLVLGWLFKRGDL